MTFGSLRTLSGVPSEILHAVVEHDDVVGNLHHHRHVVLDQQDRGAVLVADGAQQRVELGALARVEAGRRLVEAEQHRARCTWRGRSRAGAARRRAGRRPDRRRGRSGRSCRASSLARSTASRLGLRVARRRRAGRARSSPRPASAGCAARRAGSPAPSCRRTGGCSGRCGRPWRVAAISKSGMRSSRKSAAGRRPAPAPAGGGQRVDVGCGGASPRLSAMRPLVGL